MSFIYTLLGYNTEDSKEILELKNEITTLKEKNESLLKQIELLNIENSKLKMRTKARKYSKVILE